MKTIRRKRITGKIRVTASPRAAFKPGDLVKVLEEIAIQTDASLKEDNRPRQVILDNTVPGGFRMEPV